MRQRERTAAAAAAARRPEWRRRCVQSDQLQRAPDGEAIFRGRPHLFQAEGAVGFDELDELALHHPWFGAFGRSHPADEC